AASVFVSRQLPPQSVLPAGQVTTPMQTPFWHASPSPHALPHDPQFALSVATSVQAPLQLTVPFMQGFASWHLPPVQAKLAGQVTPHAPQFLPSVWRFTQRAPHWVLPVGHMRVAPPSRTTPGPLPGSSE